MTNMVLFRNEEALEKNELLAVQGDILAANLIQKGERKNEEPLHRNKKLRRWPTEAVRKEIYIETFCRESGLPGNRDAIEKWKSEKAEALWQQLTGTLGPEEQARILKEYGMSYISELVTNTIHLENMYTTIKPIGQRQWEIASKGLKALADEDALIYHTEQPELLMENGRKKKLPDWTKGYILYLSLIGSRTGKEMLNPNSRAIPDMPALKTAATWCLGNHLKLHGGQKNLEETSEIFEKWHEKRQRLQLQIVEVEIENIPEEVKVPDPHDLEGNLLPWGLAWKILPVLEQEIRELGEQVLQNEGYFHTIGNLFKKKLFDRWACNLARRAYLRKFEETQTVSERWKTATLVLNTIDDYIPTRITANFPEIRLIAKTEATWLMLTDNLPEPEFL